MFSGGGDGAATNQKPKTRTTNFLAGEGGTAGAVFPDVAQYCALTLTGSGW